MTLTREMIHAGKSEAGGWTKKQLALIGVNWPPKPGWLEKLSRRGDTIERSVYEEFLSLKGSRKPLSPKKKRARQRKLAREKSRESLQ
jgi:hypothetical protein